MQRQPLAWMTYLWSLWLLFGYDDTFVVVVACLGCGCGVSCVLCFIMDDMFVVGVCITRSLSGVCYHEVRKLSEWLWSVSLQLVCRICRNEFFKS